jgi:hypothetical protein
MRVLLPESSGRCGEGLSPVWVSIVLPVRAAYHPTLGISTVLLAPGCDRCRPLRDALPSNASTGGFCGLNLAINQAPNMSGIVCVPGYHFRSVRKATTWRFLLRLCSREGHRGVCAHGTG